MDIYGVHREDYGVHRQTPRSRESHIHRSVCVWCAQWSRLGYDTTCDNAKTLRFGGAGPVLYPTLVEPGALILHQDDR